MDDIAAALEQEADRAAAAGDPAAAARLLEQATRSADELQLWVKLSAMRRATGDFSGAITAIENGLRLAPLDLAALLARAFLLDRIGDPRAGEAYSIAAAQAPEAVPPGLASAVDRARQMRAEHERGMERRLHSLIPDLPDPEARARLARFASNSSRLTRHYHQEPTHFHYPGLPEIEFHETSAFPGVGLLEASAAEIRSEFDALIAAEAAEMVPYMQYSDRVPLRQWEELNKNPKWSAIHLLQNGRTIEANARHCPRTMAAIARLDQPQVPGASPNAMFSLLAPATRIPPHTGVANTRLVCHLPLIVPPDCGFRCGGTTREWKVGEAFVFDDTIEHEAWNNSDQLRVVLIVDLWPPALRKDERSAVATMISSAGVGFSGGI